MPKRTPEDEKVYEEAPLGETGSPFTEESLFGEFDNGKVFDYDTWSVKDMDDMLARDGKAQTLEKVLAQPIRRAPWKIEPSEGDKGEAEWLQKFLEAPANAGGMSVPFAHVIGQATSAFFFRKAFFEKVFKIGVTGEFEGKVVYDKIAWRPTSTCQLARESKRGGFAGFRQRPYDIDPELQKQAREWIVYEPNKSFVYVHGQHRDPMKGVSDLEVALWCYRTKQKIRYLWYSFLENQSLPKSIVTDKDLTKAKRVAAQVAKLKSQGVLALEAGTDIRGYESAGRGADQFSEAIRFLDSEMSGSVLAGFTDLTKAAGEGAGSFALSKDASDFFLSSRYAVADELAEAINHYLLPDLIKYNYGMDAAYPRFVFGQLSEADIADALTLLGTMASATANNLPGEFTYMLAEKVGEYLDFDVDKLHTEFEKHAKEKEEQAALMTQMQVEGHQTNMEATKAGVQQKAAQAAQGKAKQVGRAAGSTDAAVKTVDAAKKGVKLAHMVLKGDRKIIDLHLPEPEEVVILCNEDDYETVSQEIYSLTGEMGEIAGEEIALAAVNGHHVPGTAYNWRHNWRPLNAQTALRYRKGKGLAAKLQAEGKITKAVEPDWYQGLKPGEPTKKHIGSGKGTKDSPIGISLQVSAGGDEGGSKLPFEGKAQKSKVAQKVIKEAEEYFGKKGKPGHFKNPTEASAAAEQLAKKGKNAFVVKHGKGGDWQVTTDPPKQNTADVKVIGAYMPSGKWVGSSQFNQHAGMPKDLKKVEINDPKKYVDSQTLSLQFEKVTDAAKEAQTIADSTGKEAYVWKDGGKFHASSFAPDGPKYVTHYPGKKLEEASVTKTEAPEKVKTFHTMKGSHDAAKAFSEHKNKPYYLWTEDNLDGSQEYKLHDTPPPGKNYVTYENGKVKADAKPEIDKDSTEYKDGLKSGYAIAQGIPFENQAKAVSDLEDLVKEKYEGDPKTNGLLAGMKQYFADNQHIAKFDNAAQAHNDASQKAVQGKAMAFIASDKHGDYYVLTGEANLSDAGDGTASLIGSYSASGKWTAKVPDEPKKGGFGSPPDLGPAPDPLIENLLFEDVDAGKGALPKASSLSDTGQTVGTHGGRVLQDGNGDKYLWKPNNGNAWQADLDKAVNELHGKVGLPAPPMQKDTLNGKEGTLQKWLPSSPAFSGGFDAASLQPNEIKQLQQYHAVDWLISNHDAHPGQFLKTEDGKIVEIDTGQAFKHFGKDKLSGDYHPNAAFGEKPPVYNSILNGLVGYPPTEGEVGDTIDKIMAIPDAELKQMFAPYAKKAWEQGTLSGASTPGEFLEKLVERKHSLKEDMAKAYGFPLSAKEKAALKATGKTVQQKDVEITLPGPGMYADGNAIKTLMAQKKAAKGTNSEVAYNGAVLKAMKDFKAKHGVDFDEDAVSATGAGGGTFMPEGGIYGNNPAYQKAVAAGYQPVNPGDSANGSWKPTGSLKSDKGALVYSGGAYSDINKELRQHKTLQGHYSETIRQMDREFNAVPPLDKNIVVSRKMHSDGPFPSYPPPMDPGSEFVDHGYGSTSKDPNMWSGSVVMEVRIPAGTKVLDLNHTTGSYNAIENEILLNRGTRYRVVEDVQAGGTRKITVEVMNDGAQPGEKPGSASSKDAVKEMSTADVKPGVKLQYGKNDAEVLQVDGDEVVIKVKLESGKEVTTAVTMDGMMKHGKIKTDQRRGNPIGLTVGATYTTKAGHKAKIIALDGDKVTVEYTNTKTGKKQTFDMEARVAKQALNAG